jgi:hypothetical protein
MEMLVMLVVTSLVITLLMEGFSYVMTLRVRFMNQVEVQTAGLMESYWFRGVCAAMAPDKSDGQDIFWGDDGRLHGLTIAPLRAPQGAPTPVDLELITDEEEIILQYREYGGEPWELGRWTASDAWLSYLDETGQWLRQWPVQGSSRASTVKETIVQPPKQLPKGILLQVKETRGVLTWFVDLPGRQAPKPSAAEVLKNF